MPFPPIPAGRCTLFFSLPYGPKETLHLCILSHLVSRIGVHQFCAPFATFRVKFCLREYGILAVPVQAFPLNL